MLITVEAGAGDPGLFGTNLPQDAIYPISLKDADGRDYDGANNYVIRFAKGETAPVQGSWSITMYDPQFFSVANPINRYSISPRQDLKANADGSIDVLIQHESPGPDQESNWLPAPAGKFVLTLRMYWPDECDPSILDGTWRVPPVTRT